jgi:NADH-quinone oxidoreductase subunit J
MSKIIAILVALGLAFAGGGVALAQPGAPGAPARVQLPTFQPGAVAPAEPAHPHSDIVESSGQGMAFLFWAFAALTVGGALFVITRRNLIAAVMGMVGSFLGIAAVYMMLYANFLSVIQMLVYAGAIMVLFVFVIMILNRPEDEPVPPSGRIGQAIGAVSILYLVGRLAMLLVRVAPPNQAVAMNAPGPVPLPPISPTERAEMVPWGGLKAVGNDLFGPGLFPFEAISILLLVAVVGAIAIARPLKQDQETAVDTQPGGHA